MLASLMQSKWGYLGICAFVVAMVALCAMTGCVSGLRKAGKKANVQEKGEEIEMQMLGGVAGERAETSFGSPPGGPDAALDLDPQRCCDPNDASCEGGSCPR